MHHFLVSINPHSDDIRKKVPVEIIEVLAEILIDEYEREEMMHQWGEF
jgi:hypothetical protein